MFSSILRIEHLDRISNHAKLHLCGIISMQVPSFHAVSSSKNVIGRLYSILIPFIGLCHYIALLDVEFGKLQARDMLQHLWTGPISNASLDVVQGSRSVEVRAVGVTKVTRFHVILVFKLFECPYCATLSMVYILPISRFLLHAGSGN